MDFNEIKSKSNAKVLLRGKSGRGKTYNASKVAIEMSKSGYDILYIDTETEGAETLVRLVENGEYKEDDVEGIEYVQVVDYDDFRDWIAPKVHEKYDLFVVDTLDSKHTYCINKVMEDVIDEEGESMSPDWNMYPNIYAREKDIMETLQKPRTNLIATIDPDSGSIDKSKGCQTNVHGLFTIVVDLRKSSDKWENKVRNFVGRGDLVDSMLGKDKGLYGNLIKIVEDRIE